MTEPAGKVAVLAAEMARLQHFLLAHVKHIVGRPEVKMNIKSIEQPHKLQAAMHAGFAVDFASLSSREEELAVASRMFEVLKATGWEASPLKAMDATLNGPTLQGYKLGGMARISPGIQWPMANGSSWGVVQLHFWI